MGTYTQEAALVVWSKSIEQSLESGRRAVASEIRCTQSDVKVWGTAVVFSYEVRTL